MKTKEEVSRAVGRLHTRESFRRQGRDTATGCGKFAQILFGHGSGLNSQSLSSPRGTRDGTSEGPCEGTHCAPSTRYVHGTRNPVPMRLEEGNTSRSAAIPPALTIRSWSGPSPIRTLSVTFERSLPRTPNKLMSTYSELLTLCAHFARDVLDLEPISRCGCLH